MSKQLLTTLFIYLTILTLNQIKNLHILTLNPQIHYYSQKKQIILFKPINVTNKIDKVQIKSDKMHRKISLSDFYDSRNP